MIALPPAQCRTSRQLVIAANSSWNIVNFRAGLIRALKKAGYSPLVITPAHAALEVRMRSLGVHHIALDLDPSGTNPVHDLQLVFAYRRVLKRIRPAALLSFTIKPNIYGSIAASTLGIPAIVNISGLGTAFGRRRLLRATASQLYRLALRKAATVFFQNPDDQAHFLRAKLVSPEHARVLPGSGVDLDRFSPAPLPPGAPVFLVIARLLADKGIREYVAAAQILHARYPEARFQVIGPIDAQNRGAITALEVDRWVAAGLIEYLGVTEDVRPYIANSTAIVLPSYYQEGVPRSLLEGAAMARPIITTDEPGCRELLSNGEAAISCHARDVAGLAAAMERLITMSEDDRQSMGLAARQLAEDRFDEQLVISAYLDAVKLAIDPAPSSGGKQQRP